MQTIYVRVVNEDVDVWRPVVAEHVGGDRYRLIDNPAEGEEWQFAKDDVVRCERRRLSSGSVLVAAEVSPKG